jgi:hypothetical protein
MLASSLVHWCTTAQWCTQSTGQRLQRPLIAFDAWLLALGR